MEKPGNDDEYLSEPKNGFIFDESQVIRTKRLATGIIMRDDKPEMYYGFSLPKEEQQYSRKGAELGLKVIERPVIITSRRGFYQVGDKLEALGKVRFGDAPLQDRPRISLSVIDEWTAGSREGPTGKETFDAVKGVWDHYLSVADERFRNLNPLWDIGTYFVSIWKAYPYMEHVSLKPGTGKSKALKLSSLIAFNGRFLVSATAPTLFRLVERNEPALCLDEVERLVMGGGKKATETSELVELINSGYSRGATVPRWETGPDGKYHLVESSVFCPKRIAGLKALDRLQATRSRAIRQVHLPAAKDDERGDREPDELSGPFQKLRDLCYLFALSKAEEAWHLYQDSGPFCMAKEFKLDNRAWQIWKPLLVTAKLIGDDLYQEVGKAAEELTRDAAIDAQDDEDSWDGRLWRSLQELLDDKEGFVEISVSTIKDQVRLLFGENEKKPTASWIWGRLKRAGLGKFKDHTRTGNVYRLSKETLASHLTRLGVKDVTDVKDVKDRGSEGTSLSSFTGQDGER